MNIIDAVVDQFVLYLFMGELSDAICVIIVHADFCGNSPKAGLQAG